MASTARRLVVDASVVVKWFVHERDTERATALVGRAAAGELTLHAPDLCIAECANVFWKLTRGGSVTARQGRRAVHRLSELPLRLAPTVELARRAYHIAVALNMSVYDATYVALAEALDTAVMTADRRLIAKTRRSPFEGFATPL